MSIAMGDLILRWYLVVPLLFIAGAFWLAVLCVACILLLEAKAAVRRVAGDVRATVRDAVRWYEESRRQWDAVVAAGDWPPTLPDATCPIVAGQMPEVAPGPPVGTVAGIPVRPLPPLTPAEVDAILTGPTIEEPSR